MYLIAGLGNPGTQYRYNRHNAGFMFIDYLITVHNLDGCKKKDSYEYVKARLHGKEVVLIKPQTFMNLSGKSLVQAMSFFKIPLEHVLVVYDDTALPPGMIRIKERGSDGGHNGLKHIQHNLGTGVYKRIRVGIGTPEHASQLKSYVLYDIPPDQLALLQDNVFPRIDDALNLIVRDKIREAMNTYNERIKDEL